MSSHHSRSYPLRLKMLPESLDASLKPFPGAAAAAHGGSTNSRSELSAADAPRSRQRC